MRFYKPVASAVIILFSLVVFTGCDDSQSPGIYLNDKINSSLRDKIHALDDVLFTATKNDKMHDLEDIMTKEMLDNPDYNRTAELIRNQSKEGKYTLFNECYIYTVKTPAVNKVNDVKNNYVLTYQSNTKESYISMMLLQSGDDKWMVTAIYSNTDYGWRLSQLDFGRYTINKLTSPQLYQLAQQNEGKNYLVDAANNASLALKCLRPNSIWQYKVEDGISNYYGTIVTECNSKFTFPVMIEGVSSNPKIFGLSTQNMPDGSIVPMVQYLTSINVKDSVAINKECKSIKNNIGKALPGIDKDKKCILFTAYNKRPSSTEVAESYNFVDELK